MHRYEVRVVEGVIAFIPDKLYEEDLKARGPVQPGASPAGDIDEVLSRLRTGRPVQVKELLLVRQFVAAELHRERVTVNFDTIVEQMMPSLAEVDPVPYAVVGQAQRRAALRTELLATGAFTYTALAEGRGTSSANIRQWVRRARDRHEIFTVDHTNETLVPAILLNSDLSPRPEFKRIIAPLVDAGEDGWGLWAWLVSPSPWLDGAVPAAELFLHTEMVVEAAQARAAA
jgi:hypothetical protein